MRKIFISFTLGFIGFIATAQPVDEKIVGTNLLTGNDITARSHVFAERIDDFYIDTTSNCITLQLRGTSKNGKWLNNTGAIVLYDLVANREKWSQSINYQGQNISQFDNTIVFTKKKSYCLDPDTGKDKWEVKNSIYYVDPDYHIGIGYHLTKVNLLQGIDLNNGTILWDREINRDYGWNSLTFLNDSTALITAAGLHTVNLKDGTGWDYNSITGKKDYTATAVSNAAGAVLGILTGTFVMSAGHNLVRDLVSNTLITDDEIYLADTQCISCFGHDGINNWISIFDKDVVSKSNIFLKGDTLYMVNLGYAFMGERALSYGIPFIAAYNRRNGENIFLTHVGEKKTVIQGWTRKGDTALVLFDDKIVRYSLFDGSVMLEKSFEGSGTSQLTNFLGISNYVNNEGKYESLVLSNPDNIYVMDSEKIFVLNDHFEVTGEIGFDQIYVFYLKMDKYRFLAKRTQTTVIDSDNNEVATFEASRHAFLVKNKLYEVKDNVIVEIDATEFL